MSTSPSVFHQETESSITSEEFWMSANILNTKPHVVNKRLWGCNVIYSNVCKTTRNLIPCDATIRIRTGDNEQVDEKIVNQLLDEFGLTVASSDKDNIDVLLIELLPKSYTETHAFQLICMDRQQAQVMYFDVTPAHKTQCLNPEFPYLFEHQNNKVVLKTFCDESLKSCLWLKNTVLPQFLKWAKQPTTTKNKITSSLSLVNTNNYYQKYNELKIKYGKEMVKIWPECTDPSKFVYEDVAIAAYLLLLWEDERKKTCENRVQTFVDLGCGNGLLVYILTMEGHDGVGIDIRKRNIWDMYPDCVRLQEKTVTPSDKYLFPNTDWLIGNHSDELTPWIPVVAARSSYKCNFFLLPCCAYNFDGSKYQRYNSSKSQYTEYLEYIKDLSIQCGYNTDLDRLKIPSTKRICLIGRNRIYKENEQNEYCNKIQDIITNKQDSKMENKSGNWITDFKARDPVEKVRNCTRIDKNLINSIVDRITSYILDNLPADIRWSIGKTVEINTLVNLISKQELKAMKSECGGLQTLLKNHNHIFKVQGGKVQLRYPRTREELNKEIEEKSKKGKIVKMKQRPCWFHSNHPQGCPLTEETCSYAH